MPSDAETPPPGDAPEEASGEALPGPTPLGHNASRALVIGSILLVLAVSAGGTWLILDMARSATPPEEFVAPSDTSDTVAAPAPPP